MLQPVRGGGLAQVVLLEVLPASLVAARLLGKMRAVCHIGCKISHLGDWQFHTLDK